MYGIIRGIMRVPARDSSRNILRNSLLWCVVSVVKTLAPLGALGIMRRLISRMPKRDRNPKRDHNYLLAPAIYVFVVFFISGAYLSGVRVNVFGGSCMKGLGFRRRCRLFV